MGLGQLLGFLWQKEVKLLMQLLPTGTRTVSSECSIEPGTGDLSRAVEGKAGVAAGRAPGQKRQEILWAFRHWVISLFIWEEATQEALVPKMLKIAQRVLTSIPPPWAHRNSELTVSRALRFISLSVPQEGREPAFQLLLGKSRTCRILFSTCKQRKTLHLCRPEQLYPDIYCFCPGKTTQTREFCSRNRSPLLIPTQWLAEDPLPNPPSLHLSPASRWELLSTYWCDQLLFLH